MRSVSASMGADTAIMVSCFLLSSASGPCADHRGQRACQSNRSISGVNVCVFGGAGLFGAEYSALIGKNPRKRSARDDRSELLADRRQRVRDNERAGRTSGSRPNNFPTAAPRTATAFGARPPLSGAGSSKTTAGALACHRTRPRIRNRAPTVRSHGVRAVVGHGARSPSSFTRRLVRQLVSVRVPLLADRND